MSTLPEIALVELPTLAAPLTAAGYGLLSEDTSAVAVAGAARTAHAGVEAKTRPDFIILARVDTDARVQTWLSLQKTRRRVVVVHGGDNDNYEESFPIRDVVLPASLGDILAAFSAENEVRLPLPADLAGLVLEPDGSLAEPTAEIDDPFANPFDLGSAPAAPAVATSYSPAEVAEPVAPPPPVAQPRPVPQWSPPPDIPRPSPPEPRPAPPPVAHVQASYTPEIAPRAPIRDIHANNFLPAAAPTVDPGRAASAARPSVARTELCPVIVTLSGEGGVGKTGMAVCLAERAARGGSRADAAPFRVGRRRKPRSRRHE